MLSVRHQLLEAALVRREGLVVEAAQARQQQVKPMPGAECGGGLHGRARCQSARAVRASTATSDASVARSA
jgi:hypothetical protein